MHRPTVRRPGRKRALALAATAVIAATLISAGAAATRGNAAPPPSAPATATPASTPTSVPSPTAPVVETTTVGNKPGPQGQTPVAVVAERFLVHTGDGDCLNVRPKPGTQFASEVIYCAPEGQVLWLYGKSTEVDGETWRYALGAGWVATRYVQPAPATSSALPGGLKGGLVWDQEGRAFARVGPTGSITGTGNLSVNGPIIAPAVSPDGQLFAFTTIDPRGGERTLIVDAGGTQVASLQGQQPVAWRGDLLLLRRNESCSQQCMVLSLFDRATGQSRQLSRGALTAGDVAWAPDGQSVIVAAGGTTLVRLALDGTPTPLPVKFGENDGIWSISASPDGNTLLAGGGFGPLQTISLRDGSRATFQRAAPKPANGGGCGAGMGRLAAFLDATHIIYHEQFAVRGQNGLTIGNLADGSRRVLPFGNVVDLQVVAGGVVAFTTWEQMDGESHPVSWLLDVASGEARPIATGARASWIR
jgi:hypothetical protein